MRSDRVRIVDMQEAIERIEKHAQSGRDRFNRDELIQNWIIRHIQILGEAAYKTSKEFQSRHPEVPWSEIIGMRHILVHNYFEINTQTVWNVVSQDLPKLKKSLNTILETDFP